MRPLLILAALFIGHAQAGAQPHRLTGRVLEVGFDDGLRGANVVATSLADSSLSRGNSTDRAGLFSVSIPWSGPTEVRISHVGFRTYVDTLHIAGDADFGVVSLQPDVVDLEDVEVVARRDRMTIRGDTIEFYAGGFYVPRYTYAESLVEALPGFEIKRGVVFYLGKPIQRVLVDGKAYYGTDVLEALRTLPIEMIESLQVFNQLPENRQFSGVDTGVREQVVNLVTDPQKRNAVIIHINASGGTSERYALETGANHLNAPVQVRGSLSSENVNQPSRGGIQKSHRGNLHYSNTFNENTRLRVTYAGNDGLNRSVREVSRLYVGDLSDLGAYTETRANRSETASHTLSGSVRHQFGERHLISFAPRLLVLQSDAESTLSGASVGATGVPRQVSTATTAASESLTGGFSGDWEFNPGERSGIQGSLTMSFSEDESTSFQTSSLDPTSSFLAVTDYDTDLWTSDLTAGLGAMRRLGDNGYLSIGVDHMRTNRVEDRLAFTQTALDSTLSSDYDGTTVATGGTLYLGYSPDRKGISLSLGARRSSRTFKQTFPRSERVSSQDLFLNSSLSGNHQIGNWGSLNLRYDVSGSSPDSELLQRVVDNSNPLLLSVGNPELRPTVSHSVESRLTLRKPESAMSFNTEVRASLTHDLVGTEIYQAGDQATEFLGIVVPAGGQLSRQANLGDQRHLAVSGHASRSLERISGSASLDFSANLTERPVSTNGRPSATRDRSISIGAGVNGRPRRYLHVNALYTLSNSHVGARSASGPSSRYLSHTAHVGLNTISRGGLNAGSGFRVTAYERLGSDFDSFSSDWSLHASYRPRSAEQFSVTMALNDILDSADSVERSTSNLYLESTRSNRLGRHLVFAVRWEFRTFRPGRNTEGDP